MSDESPSRFCPRCGAPVPDNAPGGLCPSCLLAQAAMSTGGDGPAAQAEASPSLQQVAAVFPQLEILGLIGQGGMGAVFRARQPKLGRLIALKILPERLAADRAFAARFAREGQMLARLCHPNIVGVYDFGESGGLFYLLMEFVDGVDLRRALRSQRIPPQQALAIVPKICEALQYAHDEGVLHRDIKPENILLDAKGRVKIADFGIAKFAGPGAGTGLTGAGAALGTPHYMAPEQVERPADVDHRADIYSLGVVFYELLTGELPLGRFAPPSEKSAVDARVDEVVLRALEKERERRQQSALEVKTQVEMIATSPAPAGDRSVRAEPGLARRDDRGAPIPGAAVFVLIVACVISLATGVTGGQGPMEMTILLLLFGIGLIPVVRRATRRPREGRGLDAPPPDSTGPAVPAAPRSSPGRARASLVLLLLSLVVPATMQFAFRGAEARTVEAAFAAGLRTQAELNAARVRLDEVTTRFDVAYRDLIDAKDAEALATAEGKLGPIQREMDGAERALAVARDRYETTHAATNLGDPDRLGFLLLVSALLLGIPATVLGRQQLAGLRATGSRGGVALALLSAWFWPLLLLDVIVVRVIMAPAGAVGGPAARFAETLGGLLAAVACLVLDVFVIRAARRRMKADAGAANDGPTGTDAVGAPARPRGQVVGVLLLVLAAVVPVAWLIAWRSIESDADRQRSHQVTALYREWLLAGHQLFQARQRRDVARARLPDVTTPAAREAADEELRALTKEVDDAQLREAVLRAKRGGFAAGQPPPNPGRFLLPLLLGLSLAVLGGAVLVAGRRIHEQDASRRGHAVRLLFVGRIVAGTLVAMEMILGGFLLWSSRFRILEPRAQTPPIERLELTYADLIDNVVVVSVGVQSAPQIGFRPRLEGQPLDEEATAAARRTEIPDVVFPSPATEAGTDRVIAGGGAGRLLAVLPSIAFALPDRETAEVAREQLDLAIRGRRALPIGGSLLRPRVELFHLVHPIHGLYRAWLELDGATATPMVILPARGIEIRTEDDSAFCVHDEQTSHYVFVARGHLGSTFGRHADHRQKTWREEGEIFLPVRASYEFRRGSNLADTLIVGDRAYDLRQGRVFVLADDGTVTQRPLFPPVLTQEDLPDLMREIDPERRTRTKAAREE